MAISRRKTLLSVIYHTWFTCSNILGCLNVPDGYNIKAAYVYPVENLCAMYLFLIH